MQTNLSKKIEKIYSKFSNISNLSKAIIKYGSLAFLTVFAVGTMLFAFNRSIMHYDAYYEFIATSIIKSSFTILAEAVIGGLLMDYIFKKN